MNALSKRRAVVLLLAALIASPSLFAGEYGLTVDPSFPHPCKYAATRTLNECTPAAVVKDLRGHFISGKPFRLRAVEMAVRSGTISLSPDALPPFNDAIVDICVAEPRKDFLLLVSFLSFLVKGPMPYPSPGTACALFGFQDAAHAALQQRRRK
jgi:hypothetical protein